MEADPVEVVRLRLLEEASGNDVSLSRYLDIVSEVASESGLDRDGLAEKVRVALGGAFAIQPFPDHAR